MSEETQITPRHLWTNGGKEVLILRYVSKNGTSHGGFKHPLAVGESVTAPDWNPTMACGGGIHGWPWGFSLGDGREADWSAVWQVYGVSPTDVVGGKGDLTGKCKFKTGLLRFVGDWHGAMMFVLNGQMAWVHHAARGAASATGENGAASATGGSGAASATGDYSTVEAGPTDVAVATAENFTWIVRPGAVLLMRWQENGGGHRVLKAKTHACSGERITFSSGRAVLREKP